MNHNAEPLIEKILALLEQQQANLKHPPFTPEQIDRDREISAQLRLVCDQLPAARTTGQS
jgi:hypothetical protein